MTAIIVTGIAAFTAGMLFGMFISNCGGDK